MALDGAPEGAREAAARHGAVCACRATGVRAAPGAALFGVVQQPPVDQDEALQRSLVCARAAADATALWTLGGCGIASALLAVDRRYDDVSVAGTSSVGLLASAW